jgi:hypothetical protein
MDEGRVKAVIAEHRQQYPALIDVDQACAISRRPKATIYDWSSRGLLVGIKSRRGRRLLLDRDRFVQFLIKNDAA